MEAVCRGASEGGGESIGVIIEGRGEPNAWVTRPVVAADLPDRLRLLRDLSGAAIFLPHGLGTMLELIFFAESIVKGDVPPRPLVLLGGAWKGTADLAIAEASSAEGRGRLSGCVVLAETPGEAAAAARRS
jgi:predicted Rossmann-fold nucleotide-binding protein